MYSVTATSAFQILLRKLVSPLEI